MSKKHGKKNKQTFGERLAFLDAEAEKRWEETGTMSSEEVEDNTALNQSSTISVTEESGQKKSKHDWEKPKREEKELEPEPKKEFKELPRIDLGALNLEPIYAAMGFYKLQAECFMLKNKINQLKGELSGACDNANEAYIKELVDNINRTTDEYNKARKVYDTRRGEEEGLFDFGIVDFAL